MEIFNKVISEKAEKDIKNLTSAFSKKTEFFDITQTTLKGFGAVYHDNPEMYEVYVSSLLEGEAFETNIICELLHIKEAENGFPTSGIKNSETVLKEKNVAFFQYLNHSLQSAVLDINVFSQLVNMGYDTSFFTNHKLKLIKEVSPEINMEDKYNQASFALQFILFALTAKNEEYEEAKNFLNSIFNGYADEIVPMIEDIKKIGYDTPYKAAQIMAYITDKYSLWDVFYIQLGNDKIRTKGTYRKYFNIEE